MRKHKGFTLIEILVVFSILGVLGGIVTILVSARHKALMNVEVTNSEKESAIVFYGREFVEAYVDKYSEHYLRDKTTLENSYYFYRIGKQSK